MGGVGYLLSINGICRLAQEFCNFIGFMCVVFPDHGGKGTAFLISSVGAFIITAILILLYVFDIPSKAQIPFPLIELGYSVAWAIFYLITSALAMRTSNSAVIAGGVFGLFAVIGLLVDAFDNFKRIRAGA